MFETRIPITWIKPWQFIIKMVRKSINSVKSPDLIDNSKNVLRQTPIKLKIDNASFCK